MSLSFQQELRLSGSKRERGPHACRLHFPQRSMLLATGLAGPPQSALASIQVHSPGASQMLAPRLQGAGLARGTGRRAGIMLLQAVGSVLVLGFRLPQEFPRTEDNHQPNPSPNQRSCLACSSHSPSKEDKEPGVPHAHSESHQ